MALDRGTLAKIDRRVFAELAHTAATQVVKVPLSDAVWSTWRRYCEAIGLSMGAGVAGLIDHELRSVVDDAADEGAALSAVLAAQRMAARQEAFAIRERELEAREELLRGREQQLRSNEERLRTMARQVRQGVVSQTQWPTEPRSKIGRNDRCPCGSGLKHKHCHGLVGYR
jgi:hypothetical protein